MSQEYKVGEWYVSSDERYENKVIGYHEGHVIWFDTEQWEAYNDAEHSQRTKNALHKRIKDEHGNPVPPPEDLKDRPYPVKIDCSGAYVDLPVKSMNRVAGEVIGASDPDGYICIGFKYVGLDGIYPHPALLDSQVIKFPTHAVFRHYSKVSQ